MPFGHSIISLFLFSGIATSQQLTKKPIWDTTRAHLEITRCPANDGCIKPDTHLGETRIVKNINCPKLTGDTLASLYRKYTGRRVIVSSIASTAEFSFIQDASPQHPLTYADAAELLKKAVNIEGFTFIPDRGKDPNLDILTPTVTAAHGCVGVSVYNESDTLPAGGDVVISYVMTFKNINSTDAAKIISSRIGEAGSPYGSLGPIPNSSVVVITESTAVIRRLIDAKKEIDKPL